MERVGMDPEDLHRFMRIYRGAKLAGDGVRGLRRVKRMLDDHAEQTDVLMDGEEIVTRVRERRVRSEDVRAVVRAAVNSAPTVYKYVAKHVRESRKAEDA